MGALHFVLFLASVVLVVPWVQGAYKGYDDYEDDLPSEDCNIQYDYTTPFVTALFEQVDLSTGCRSSQKTFENREVYIINLLQGTGGSASGTVPSGLNNDGPSEVNAVITPKAKTGVYSGRMIFVLNSDTPVNWNINSEHISNETRHLFWISKNSRIKDKDNDIRIKIKKMTMPLDRYKLLKWVKTQPETATIAASAGNADVVPTPEQGVESATGAVTSFTEIEQNEVNTILIKIGIDPQAPAICDLNSPNANKPQPDVTALSLHVQQTNACVAKFNQGYHDRDVHILELHETDLLPASSESPDIVLDITAVAKKSKLRNLILVLKSHQAVRWKVQAKGFRGTIEIITDHQVDTNNIEDQLQSLSVAAEKLEKEGAELIEWTKERYGPAVSYTEVDMANKFRLLVDGADTLNGPPGSKPKRSPFDTPEQTRKAVITARNVDCGSQKIKVVLNKTILNSYGVFREHLSLLNESCQAVDNATHYILETRLTDCGTTRRITDHEVLYKNAIVVKRLPDDVIIDDGDFSGGGYDLNPLDSTHMDDEDLAINYKIDLINTDFSCSYNVGGQDNSPMYNLHLFIESTFEAPVLETQFPIKVADQAKIFVQVSMIGDTDLSLVVENCKLNLPASTKKQPLISNRCNMVDPSLKQLPSPDPHKFRFSFTFRDYIKDEADSTRYYITCLVDACSNTDRYGPGIERCLSAFPNENVACLSRGSRTTPPALDFAREVISGPLIMTDSPTGQSKTGMVWPKPEKPGLGKKEQTCQQTPTPGLESGTVVIITFAAFFIGVLLVAALWFIHSKTAAKSSLQRQRFGETSGESTPSSTAPITIHQVSQHA